MTTSPLQNHFDAPRETESLSVTDLGFQLAATVAANRNEISIVLGRDQATLNLQTGPTLAQIHAFGTLLNNYLALGKRVKQIKRTSENLASIRWVGELLQSLFNLWHREIYRLILSQSNSPEADEQRSAVLIKFQEALRAFTDQPGVPGIISSIAKASDIRRERTSGQFPSKNPRAL
jgi:hypothetical protein